MKLTLQGVLAPVVTPFDEAGEILYDRLAANSEYLCSAGLHGLVVLGSNGEAVMLEEREKGKVWDKARAAIPPGKLFLAGAGSESLRASMVEVKMAAGAGAQAALVVTPHYYRGQMDSPALIDFYRRLADASPIPLILYNMPRSTGVDLDVASVVALSTHGNIVGLKDSGGNLAKMGAVIGSVPSDFAVLAGSAGFFYPALALGARGMVAALANLAPQACCQLYQAFREGQEEEARLLQLRLIPINAAVTERWSVPGLKAAVDEQNICYGGPPRLPLRPLGEEERAALRKLMQEAGI